MVPTEVLAEQHFSAVRALLGDLEGPGGDGGRRGAGGAAHQPGQGRRRAPPCSPGWPSGDVGLVVGTHALLTEEVRVRLARRGGDRRAAPLRGRAAGDAAGQGDADGDPDLLVMTATPIPAHGRHGDLRRPRPDRRSTSCRPGRTPVTTVWLPGEDRSSAEGGLGTGSARRWRPATGPSSCAPWSRTRPRVEAKSATEEFERLAATELAGLRVGLMHGQMAAGGAARRSWTASARASCRCWWPRR